MELIKIYPDRVQIKSNNEQLSNVSIHSAMLIRDSRNGAALVCLVTAISRNDQTEQFDFEGNLLESEPSSTIECGILGSLRDGKFEKFVDQYPTSNVKIDLVSDELFGAMISTSNGPSFRLGSYAGFHCPAYLDGNKFFQRHSAIVGSTGSGKSVTAASLLEKVSKLDSANVIVFDLHGEYANLSFVKRVEIGADGLSFPIWFLPLRDVYSNLLRVKEESSQLQVAALRKAFYFVRGAEKGEDVPVAYQLSQLLEELKKENNLEVETGEVYKTGAKAGVFKTVKGENNGKLTGIISLLRDKERDERYRFMTRPEPQDYLFRFIHALYAMDEKRIKVLDLSSVPSEMVPTVIAVTAKLIYKVHLQQDRDRLVPLSLFCDEAHNYIPSSESCLGASQRRMLDVFETIAKEGRKFGVSMTIISQRPSELNKTILSQCANFIVLKLSNEADKQVIRGILPEGSRSAVESAVMFRPGDCLVVGDSAGIPLKIRVDLPNEQPSSSTIDTWDAWDRAAELDTDALVERILKEGRM